MGHYRLYFLDERGRIVRPLDLECDTDQQALTLAREHRRQHGMELWQGTRLVGRIPSPAADVPAESST